MSEATGVAVRRTIAATIILTSQVGLCVRWPQAGMWDCLNQYKVLLAVCATFRNDSYFRLLAAHIVGTGPAGPGSTHDGVHLRINKRQTSRPSFLDSSKACITQECRCGDKKHCSLTSRGPHFPNRNPVSPVTKTKHGNTETGPNRHETHC